MAAINIDLRDQADGTLLRHLSIQGVGYIELSARGLHPGGRRGHLEIRAAHRQNYQIPRIFACELARPDVFRRRTVVVPCREVCHRLRKRGSEIEEMKGP